MAINLEDLENLIVCRMRGKIYNFTIGTRDPI